MVRERDPTTGRYKRKEEETEKEEVGYQDTEEIPPAMDSEETLPAPAPEQILADLMREMARAQKLRTDALVTQMKEMIENSRVQRELSADITQMRERVDGLPVSREQTLKPSEIYLFKSTSRQDEHSARIFIERIRDA